MRACWETRTRRGCARDDEGYTLVELLVVMLVLGIIAAIAIPLLMNQKSKGYGAQLKSDLHEAAVAEEGYAQDHNGVYLMSGTGTDLAAEGFAATTGVTVTVTAATSGTGYCLNAVTANLTAGAANNTQWYTNQGADSGVIQASRPANC